VKRAIFALLFVAAIALFFWHGTLFVFFASSIGAFPLIAKRVARAMQLMM